MTVYVPHNESKGEISMKKMKTKRFLSLLLALAMSFSMAMPAFAAEPYGDPFR